MKLSGVITYLLLVGMAFAGAGDGSWLRKVSEKDRARLNPLANDPDALQPGPRSMLNIALPAMVIMPKANCRAGTIARISTPSASKKPLQANFSGAYEWQPSKWNAFLEPLSRTRALATSYVSEIPALIALAKIGRIPALATFPTARTSNAVVR